MFPPRKQDIVIIPSSPGKVQAVPDCDMANMVRTLNGAIAAVSQDTARIQRAYQQLCTENISRDLTAMVREYGSSPAATQPYGPPTPTARPRPAMQADVLDADGNLRAADIGITWEDNETFLHGVRVVGPKFSRPTGQEPVMSTPYPRGGNDDQSSSSMTTQPPSLETPVIRPEREVHLHRSSPEARQGYQPAAPIQRFNNKSLNWPAWFCHFHAVADVHGWSKEQSVTTGVLPRRDHHECGTGAGGQRPIQLRRTSQAVKRSVQPSLESVGIPLSISRRIASSSQRCGHIR